MTTNEANHSPPFSSGVKSQWYYDQSPICLPVVHRPIYLYLYLSVK